MDIREAQAKLGHSSVTTTEIFVRKKRGSKATPTRKVKRKENREKRRYVVVYDAL